MKEYTVKISGIDHTFQLSDEDAKARGLDPAKDGKTTKAAESPLVPATKSAEPANKAVTPANK